MCFDREFGDGELAGVFEMQLFRSVTVESVCNKAAWAIHRNFGDQVTENRNSSFIQL